MKVVFFGTPNFVEPIIKVLNENFELLEVFRNPKEISSGTMQQLNNLFPDVFVVASFGKIFSKEFLGIPKYGILNVHPSLLPKYRGPTPVQTAILNGDKKTGISIIKIDEEVDHGPVLVQKEIEINDNDTSETLLKKTFELGAKMLPKVLSNYISSRGRSASGRKGQIKLSPQDDSKATFTQHLTKENGFINLDNPQSPEILDRMIRAYYPWPGVWFKTKLGGQNRVVKLLPDKKIQVEGKNPMTYKDFINGYKEGKEILSKLKIENSS